MVIETYVIIFENSNIFAQRIVISGDFLVNHEASIWKVN